MNVLSLFDGISAGRLALERAGIPVDTYYKSEIDKHALKVSTFHYPLDVNLGDVQGWKDWDIDWSSIDLLIGGSPCMGFSFAGKQLAFDDPRSKLFFEYSNILKHIQSLNPKVKFMLENVRMKKEYLEVISSYLDVQPVLINSSLVSAQNRVRFYWANFPISQPQDKNVSLSSIIDITHASAVCGAYRGRYLINGVRQDSKMKTAGLTEQRLELRMDNKTNCITTVAKDAVLVLDGAVRNFTTVEYARLQNFPDNWCNSISKTQALKAYGNSWTVDVISHILKDILKQNTPKRL